MPSTIPCLGVTELQGQNRQKFPNLIPKLIFLVGGDEESARSGFPEWSSG